MEDTDDTMMDSSDDNPDEGSSHGKDSIPNFFVISVHSHGP